MASTTEYTRTFRVATGQTVLKGDRIKLTASGLPPTISVAGAGEDFHGTALRGAAAEALVACKLRNDSGTVKMRAGAAIVALAPVYGAASGEIDDAASGEILGIALEAASAADEFIEVLVWNNVDNIIAQIEDVNGNEVVIFAATASAVNEITFTNAATGDNPTISATGEADTGITFENLGGEEILILDSVASSVNELTIKSAATGNKPIVAATGEADNGIEFHNDQAEEILILASAATSVNEITITSTATGANPEISCTGEADTGITLANSEGEEIAICDSVATSIDEFTFSSAAAGGPVLSVTGDTANQDMSFTPAGTGDVVVTTGHVKMGDGGAVTQITTSTTTVVLNSESGQITTEPGTLAADAEESFTVTNNRVAATDVVVVNLATYGGTGEPFVVADTIGAGSFKITVSNLAGAAALNQLMVINFAIVGGSST